MSYWSRTTVTEPSQSGTFLFWHFIRRVSENVYIFSQSENVYIFSQSKRILFTVNSIFQTIGSLCSCMLITLLFRNSLCNMYSTLFHVTCTLKAHPEKSRTRKRNHWRPLTLEKKPATFQNFQCYQRKIVFVISKANATSCLLDIHIFKYICSVKRRLFGNSSWRMF
jgi:hypothetical protein